MQNRIAIGIKLPPDLIEEVDQARDEFDFPPSRTEVIEKAIREWLDRHRQQRRAGGNKR
jgi:metal-responsive CopG/Arc/MetJ family transcriptional regulator